MGPTAAGKTDLALALQEKLPCDLISVDSALIYRGMDIGTAKPEPELLAQVPHRLIDILDPVEAYSAARFREDALAAMAQISSSGRVPLLVGGTMLYFRALEHGLADLPAADEYVRERLASDMARLGLSAMHERLRQIDPESAVRIHPNDPQRILRALEVYEISGKSMTALHRQAAKQRVPYRLAKLIIAPKARTTLHERIERRFQQMLTQGFVEEVTKLRERGDLDLSMPSMRAVGYRQVWEYLDGDYDYDEMVRRGVVATRRFSKRQLTWLRAEKDAIWLDSESLDLPDQSIKYITDALKISDWKIVC